MPVLVGLFRRHQPRRFDSPTIAFEVKLVAVSAVVSMEEVNLFIYDHFVCVHLFKPDNIHAGSVYFGGF